MTQGASGSRGRADLLERAARRRGRVRLLYGAAPYVVEVLAFDGALVTGACEGRGVLRFRLDAITEAQELPSSDPLF